MSSLENKIKNTDQQDVIRLDSAQLSLVPARPQTVEFLGLQLTADQVLELAEKFSGKTYVTPEKVVATKELLEFGKHYREDYWLPDGSTINSSLNRWNFDSKHKPHFNSGLSYYREKIEAVFGLMAAVLKSLDAECKAGLSTQSFPHIRFLSPFANSTTLGEPTIKWYRLLQYALELYDSSVRIAENILIHTHSREKAKLPEYPRNVGEVEFLTIIAKRAFGDEDPRVKRLEWDRGERRGAYDSLCHLTMLSKLVHGVDRAERAYALLHGLAEIVEIAGPDFSHNNLVVLARDTHKVILANGKPAERREVASGTGILHKVPDLLSLDSLSRTQSYLRMVGASGNSVEWIRSKSIVLKEIGEKLGSLADRLKDNGDESKVRTTPRPLPSSLRAVCGLFGSSLNDVVLQSIKEAYFRFRARSANKNGAVIELPELVQFRTRQEAGGNISPSKIYKEIVSARALEDASITESDRTKKRTNPMLETLEIFRDRVIMRVMPGREVLCAAIRSLSEAPDYLTSNFNPDVVFVEPGKDGLKYEERIRRFDFPQLLLRVVSHELAMKKVWSNGRLGRFSYRSGVSDDEKPNLEFLTTPIAALRYASEKVYGLKHTSTIALNNAKNAELHLDSLGDLQNANTPSERLLVLAKCLVEAYAGIVRYKLFRSRNTDQTSYSIGDLNFTSPDGKCSVIGRDLIKEFDALIDEESFTKLNKFNALLARARNLTPIGRSSYDSSCLTVGTPHRGMVKVDSFLSDIGVAVIEYDSHKRETFLPRKTTRLESQLAAVDPELLFKGLCLFGWEKDTQRAYLAFQARIRSDNGRRISSVDSSAETKRLSGPQVYVAALAEAIANNNLMDFSKVGIDAHREYLRDLCLMHYDGDYARLFSQIIVERQRLEKEASPKVSSTVNQVLDQICPEIEEMFKKAATIVAPTSLKTKLFPHQQVALAEAVFFGKRINGLEMGLGKTVTAYAAAELLGARRVLWISDAAARRYTATELASHSDVDEKRITWFSSQDLLGLSVEQLEARVADTKYLIIAYQTLSQAMKKRPDVIAFLRDWAGPDDLMIVDEGHRFDKPTSQRSIAVNSMGCPNRLLLSGTLYQSHYRRFGYLLGLSQPQKYPNTDLLAKLCEDPKVARSLIHQNVTLGFIDSIAKPFDPPEVRSFAAQLATGVPHIPKAVDQPTRYLEVSEEQARAYYTIAVHFDKWYAERRGGGQSSDEGKTFRQIHLLRQCLYTPDKLGISGPNVLVSGAKEIAIPAMERGEKVLIFCQHQSLIRNILSDPDLVSFGVVRIDGSVSPDERLLLVNQLEEDPDTRVAVVQFDAGASTLNMRSIDHVIYLEHPRMVSTYLQSRGRPRRILGEGDERFAREKVNYWHLVPKLPDSFVEKIEDANVKRVFAKGAIGQIEHERLCAERERFAYFTRRQKAFAEIGDQKLKEYMGELTSVAQRVVGSSKTDEEIFSLLSKRQVQAMPDYANPLKERWHLKERQYIAKHAHLISVAHAKAVVLSGPKGTELPVLEAEGFTRSNIIAVEGGNIKEREEFLNTLSGKGYELHADRVLNVVKKLAQANIPLGLFSLDLDHYVTPEDVETFRHLKIAEYAIIIKNAQTNRTKNESQELLALIDGQGDAQKQKLDVMMLSLVGTVDTNPFGDLEGVEAVRVYKAFNEHAATFVRELLSKSDQLSDLSPEVTAKLVVDSYIGAPLVRDIESFKYISINHTPFLSTFALLQRLPEAVKEGEFVQLMHVALTIAIEASFKDTPHQLALSVYGDKLQLLDKGELLGEVAIDTVRREIDSFEAWISKF